MHRSRVYGVFIDVPSAHAERSVAFWEAAFGAPAEPVAGEEQFITFGGVVPDLVTAIQTVDDLPRYHIDIETDDVEAEVARLLLLGAEEVSRWLDCHVLQAPSRHLLCVIPVHSAPELFAARSRVWS